MKKIITLSFVFVLALLFVFDGVAFGKQNSKIQKWEKPEIPEIEGLYDDPEHENVKVRVFVHKEKPPRASASALVCDLADPQSEATVAAAFWKLPSTWTYNLNPSSAPSSVGSANLAVIAANGFSDWSNATLSSTSATPKVVFTKGANTTVSRSAFDGLNVITWGRTQGTALGVTYIRYYSSTGIVVDVDTIMNKKFPWKWSNSSSCAYPDAYDAENILNHELGHWMGLDDMYDSANYQHATMFGYGSKGEVKKNTLTTGDIQGILSIYP